MLKSIITIVRSELVIICICKGVSDRVIHEAIKSGCGTVRQVGGECAAGTDCGACRAQIHGMLGEMKGPHERNATQSR